MARKKILIVDDEELILMLTEHILSEQYDTVCASSGEEAVALYEKERPDLILSDLVMPGMGGFEMMDIMRTKYGRSIPIMFMTAQESEENELRGFESGAVDYIRKPLKADDLLRRVNTIMAKMDRLHILQRSSRTDSMTGLLNKSAVAEAVTEAIRKGRGILVVVSIDNMTMINETFGHDKGDIILVRFAKMLSQMKRPIDILGRTGGDEFHAWHVGTDDDELVAMKTKRANEEIRSYAKEIFGADKEASLGVTVGAVICPENGTDFRELYDKAKQAASAVKARGGRGFAFYQEPGRLDAVSEPAGSGVLRQIEETMGEAKRRAGAYVLGVDEFAGIYRFLARLVTNYSRNISLVVFTVECDLMAGISAGVAADRFMDVAADCLRSSDVMAKYSENQIVLLIVRGENEDSVIPLTRIMDRWRMQPAIDGIRVRIDREMLS